MKVLVVGGASGLGKALVEQAMRRGDSVWVIDADREGLDRLDRAAERVLCDISEEAAIDGALEVLRHEPPFDLVVLSAGISATGRFENMDPGIMIRVVAVNLVGTTTALLKCDLIARGGRLVFVSSLSHFVSYPGASAYAASKDGIVVFAQSIRRAQHAVSVQVVTPGPMETPHAERYSPPNGKKGSRADPKEIAAVILRKTSGGVIVPGVTAKLAAFAGRVAPSFVGRMMRHLIYARL
ncbi:MAG: SDR family oxidoreductase [Pseudaminobacter sp.]|nr:SDR family oxidoreductase [Pseudaminobacter sp.]